MRLPLVFLLTLLGLCAQLQAATVTAVADGPWTAPATWGSAIPDASSDVVIPNGRIVSGTTGDYLQAKSLTVNGALNLTAGASGVVNLDVAEDVTIAGTLSMGNASTDVSAILNMSSVTGRQITGSGTGSISMISGSNSNRSKISFDASSLQITLPFASLTGSIAGPLGGGTVAVGSGTQLSIPAETSLSLTNITTFSNAGTLQILKRASLNCGFSSAFTNTGTINWTIGLGPAAILNTTFATLGGTLNRSLPVDVTPSNGSLATFITTTNAASTTPTISVGGFTITPDPAWADDYLALDAAGKTASRVYTFSYLLSDQNVTFSPSPLTVSTGTAFALPTVTAQGATLTYSQPELVSNGSPALSTISGTTLNTGASGELIRIRYSAPAISTYGALSSFVECTVIQSPTVSISTSTSGPWKYGDQITLTVNTNSGGSVTWITSSLTNATFDGTSLLAVNSTGAGGSITAQVAANGIYAAGSATLNLGTFASRAVTVTVDGGARAYNVATNPTPTFTITSGSLGFGDSLATLGTPTYGGTGLTATSTTPVTPGGYPVTMTLSGTPATYAVTIIDGALIITRAAQTIAFAPLAGIEIGQTSTLTATATSGLPVSFTSGTPSVASISGSVATGLLQGSSLITASQAGDSNWLAAPSVNQSLAVGLQIQTITFPAIAALKVGETGSLAATASSGLAVTYTSSDINIAQISGSTVVAIAPGTVTITATQPGNGTYAAATPVTATLNIGKADQTITFTALTTSIEVGASANLGATSSAGLAITYSSSAATIARIAGATVVGVAPGTATITASQPGTANYNPATQVAITVTVVAAPAGTTSGTPEKTPEGGGCGAGSGIALLLCLGAWLGYRRRSECSVRP